MRSRNIYRIVIGILMLLSGGVFLILNPTESVSGTILITGGLVFLLTGVLRHSRYGDGPESDERSRRIGAFGLSYAWLTGLFFMFCLFWLDSSGIVRLDTQVALAASITVLGVSAGLYQCYLFRRGDVEPV